MSDRFKTGPKEGPGGTKGDWWVDTKSGDHGHTGHETKPDGTKEYHETDHRTGETKGWSWNPSSGDKKK